MNIEIDTNDNNLAYELMNKTIEDGVSLAKGEEIQINENFSVTYDGAIMQKVAEVPNTIQLIIAFGSGVASSYVGSWLYNKIHGKATGLRINHREIQIDEGEITKIIETTIEE